jgi:hypothetical protein
MTAAQSNARAGLLQVEERTHANNQLLAPSFLNFTTIRVILFGDFCQIGALQPLTTPATVTS